MQDFKLYAAHLSNAQDAFEDAMNAETLAGQLRYLNLAKVSLVEAKAAQDFPFWFCFKKSDGSFEYQMPGPSTLAQVNEALYFVDVTIGQVSAAIRHLPAVDLGLE